MYVRNTLGRVYNRFEVPIGASYACGNNNHNIFNRVQEEKESNETIIGIHFSGIQVQGTLLFVCVCVCVRVCVCSMSCSVMLHV